MPFRVTPSALFGRARYDLAGTFERLARVQNQISSTRRINVLSDDATGGAKALNVETALLRSLQARDALSSARFSADTQANALQSVSDLVVELRAKATQAANGGVSASDAKALAQEIDDALEQLLGYANQRVEGRYLFAGSRVDVVPFVATRKDGRITGVAYRGDDVSRRVRLPSGDTRDVDLTGAQAFLRKNRGTTIVQGATGLAAAAGAAGQDTIVGSARVVLAHVATTFGDGTLPGGGDSVSGVRPGTSTAADTILGPAGAHVLTFTTDGAGGGTVSLNGGEPIPFSGGETDFRVDNGDDAVHLDLGGLTPGFTGTVALAASGTVAIDGGPPAALSYGSDVLVKDAEGRAVHLDTGGVLRAGENLLVFPGTASLFDSLIELRDEILGQAGFGPELAVSRIQARLTQLDRAHELSLEGLTQLGARSAGFQRSQDSLELLRLSLEERRGELVDTDLLAASIELTQAENAYQTALNVAARLSRPTLLNFL